MNQEKLKRHLKTVRTAITRIENEDINPQNKLAILKERLRISKQKKCTCSMKEARESLTGPLLTKQQRYNAWTSCFNSNIISKCGLCGVHLVNMITSPMLTMKHVPNVKIFVCKLCHLHECKINKVWREQSFKTIGKERLCVWLKYYGFRTEAKCVCCLQETLTIMSSSWHEAHEIARAKGGERKLSNLIPVCSTCNLHMGTNSVTSHSTQFNNNHVSIKTAISDNDTLQMVVSTLFFESKEEI